MEQISIRQYRPEDQRAVLNICYRTGFLGEDLSGQNKFNDQKLFGYLFCLYYLLYEPTNCFVAVTAGKEVVGYIIGTANSRRQSRNSIAKMGMRIVGRLLLVTSWRYPESFRATLYFLASYFREHPPRDLQRKYPAQLHMNLLPQYQGQGIGSKLISRFEKQMAELAVTGIHLKTSNRNLKAVPFYQKKGYQLLYDHPNDLWPGVADNHSLIFVKALK